MEVRVALGSEMWAPNVLTAKALGRRVLRSDGGSPESQNLGATGDPMNGKSCVAGSLSGLEALFILLAIYGATVQKPMLAAFGAAGATYMSALPLVLCIPLMLLLARGLEDCPLEYQPESRVRFTRGLGRLGVLRFAAALVGFALLLAYFSS
eukprot:gene11716-13834_t